MDNNEGSSSEQNDNSSAADIRRFIGSTARPKAVFNVTGRATGTGEWKVVEAANVNFSMETKKSDTEGDEDGEAEIAEFLTNKAEILIERLADNRARVTVTPDGEEPVSSTGPYTSSGEFKITGIRITIGRRTASEIAFKREGTNGVNTQVAMKVGIFWGYIKFSPIA